MKNIFILLLLFGCTKQQWAIHPQLLKKRFNEVCFIQAHNATSNKDSLVQNQDHSLEQQLASGIRSMKIPLHYDYANPIDYYYDLLVWYFKRSQRLMIKSNPRSHQQILYACHGMDKEQLYGDYIDQLFDMAPAKLKPLLNIIREPLKKAIAAAVHITFGDPDQVGGILPFTPCLLDRSRTPLKTVLATIKKFLENNPQEVFSLKIEDFTDHDFADIAKEFEQSGILAFAHVQKYDQPWPTLEEMIAGHKRLVILITHDIHDRYPWANAYWFFDQWHAQWNFQHVADLIKTNFDPQQEFGNPLYRDNQPPYNKFLTIHQVVTPAMAGDKDEATKVNAYAPFLYRAQQLAIIAGHIPNFISVDFYEYPNLDVFKVQNALNGIS